jgi:hypothetical protein
MRRILFPTSPRLRLLLGSAVCTVAAWIAAIASVSTIGLLPPRLEPRQLGIAGAGARILVDNPRPLIDDGLAEDGDFQTLRKRAVLLANLMDSSPVVARIARHAHIGATQLVARTLVSANVQAVLIEPDSERRAVEIATANSPYRLEIHPDRVLPTLNVYAQAPTVREAERLADAAAPGLRDYLRALAEKEGTDPRHQLVLEQPAHARGAIINGGARIEIFGVTFVLVFALAAFLLLFVAKLRGAWAGGVAQARPGAPPMRAAPARHVPVVAIRSVRSGAPTLAQRLGLAVAPAIAVGPSGAVTVPGAAAPPAALRLDAMSRRAALRAGDWPRTTRVLPWMLAAMIAMVWLVPFGAIELSYSLPIDLKLDRLVLPFIIATWALTLAAGGPGVPRLRLTWIHVALGGVTVAALLSLVVGAHDLNQVLELDTSVKKLTVLASYISLFVVVASSIRKSELSAFVKLTFVLAVICALGTIWEFRFAYNVFYDLPRKLLPSPFVVGQAESGLVDGAGRALTRGPGDHPLEAVAMLSMALPIALVGLLSAKDARRRLLYGIGACLMLAAAFSTYRKTALLAPVSACLTLAYFRRRELLRLAPLALVFVVVIQLLTPGAAQNIVNQLQPAQLGADTVSDRSSDYDAVRPDVWSHLAFGRGYGSYEPQGHRILDMELLRQLVEVGLFGVVAFILLIAAIVGVARRPIRDRKPTEATVGLVAAAAAVVLLTVSMLFDVMAFPHCPYIALWLAGLLAVAVRRPHADDRESAWSS